jgi:hypothetical protein
LKSVQDENGVQDLEVSSKRESAGHTTFAYAV